MTKMELVDQVVENTNLQKKDAKAAVEAVFQSIEAALINGDKVQVLGFGTFEVRERAARKAKNLHTGEEIDVPAAKAPCFKAGKALKAAVNK